MSQEIIIQAKPEDAGQRLDSFLAERLPTHTRAQLSKLIKDAQVSINTLQVKPSHKITGYETVVLAMPVAKSSELIAQNLELDIIYSDEHIAVINKACGMVVHPGAGVFDNTLVNALLYYFPNMQIGMQERPGIVHRLDKDTSGVMVVALTHQAHVALSNDFKNRQVEKIYRAFCYGEFEKESFELKTGHVRHPFNRLRFFTGLPVPLSKESKVRMAHTSFRSNYTNYGLSDIRAYLYTGRTHQIRAHLADINHPLVGDCLYGGQRELPKNAPLALREAIKKLSGQALHAESLAFFHPVSKKRLEFSAPLPAQMQAISAILEKRGNNEAHLAYTR